jgi:hypothetical protein
MNAYVRFRLALTEQEPTIKPYEEARWAELADAKSAPVDVSLALLDSLHDRWVRLLHSLKMADFARTFRHPDHGVRTVDWLLFLYAWHGRRHGVAQTKRLVTNRLPISRSLKKPRRNQMMFLGQRWRSLRRLVYDGIFRRKHEPTRRDVRHI